MILLVEYTFAIRLHEIDGVDEATAGNTIAVFPFGGYFVQTRERALQFAQQIKLEIESERT